MRILHLGDLHIGKRVFGYSLLDDQKYFFNKTIEVIEEEKIDVVLIAGDIYDNGNPSAEAMTTLDDFLNKLSDCKVKTLLIPGNHDVAERFTYGSSFFKRGGIYMINNVESSLEPIIIDSINFYLVPFINHHDVNRLLATEYKNYEEAFAGLINAMNIDKEKTNILVAHQLVLPRSGDLLKEGSEDPIIGNVGNISASVLSDFDYAALGHIHKPQTVGNNIRYCGSPLAYHSDETKNEKSYTIIEVDGKNVSYYTKPIIPRKRVSVLKGKLDDVLKNHPDCINDYVYVKLTDDTSIENLMDKIKSVYKYALNVEYVRLSAIGLSNENSIDVENIKIDDLFLEFYLKQNGIEASEYQKEVIEELLGGKK